MDAFVSYCYQCTSEFTVRRNVWYNDELKSQFDTPFAIKNTRSELVELQQAKTRVDQLDALYDAVYYMLQSVSACATGVTDMQSNLSYYLASEIAPVDVDEFRRKPDGSSECKQHQTGALWDAEKICTFLEERFIKPLENESDESRKWQWIWSLVKTLALFMYHTFPNPGWSHVRACWDMVHWANMSKFGPGAYKDSTGKVCKPPGWIGPEKQMINYLQSQFNS
jgi:hypothetical protein